MPSTITLARNDALLKLPRAAWRRERSPWQMPFLGLSGENVPLDRSLFSEGALDPIKTKQAKSQSQNEHRSENG